MPGGGHYVGDFNADFKPHGEGTEFAADGSEAASGQWRDGNLHGRGRQTHFGGQCYEGDFADGKNSGLGTYTWTNGVVFEGEFEADDFNGLGIEWTADGKIVKCGRWANNVLMKSCPVPRSRIRIGKFLSAAGELRPAGGARTLPAALRGRAGLDPGAGCHRRRSRLRLAAAGPLTGCAGRNEAVMRPPNAAVI